MRRHPTTQKDDQALVIESMEDWERLLAKRQHVVVMFTSRFCGSCSRMKQSYLTLRRRVRRDTPLVIIDIDTSDKQLCVNALGEIAFVPAFQIYKKGERVAYFMANNDDDLCNKVLDFQLGQRFAMPNLSCWTCLSGFSKKA